MSHNDPNTDHAESPAGWLYGLVIGAAIGASLTLVVMVRAGMVVL